MLIDPTRSSLLVIDVQQRLLPAVQEHESIEKTVCDLIEIAAQLRLPVIYSEHYPKGLGATSDAVLKALPESATRIEKRFFSCASEPGCAELIRQHTAQVIICGMETHVCVLQTALELKAQGMEVFVVADAVSSRTAINKALGLERMRQNGVEIVTKEMVIFEWLKRAATEDFRSISKAYLR